MTESLATEIRHLHSRTRSVEVRREREKVKEETATGVRWNEELVPVYEEEPCPDIDRIRELVDAIPNSLRDQVRALSGEAKDLV